jgi:hypothetical protein
MNGERVPLDAYECDVLMPPYAPLSLLFFCGMIQNGEHCYARSQSSTAWRFMVAREDTTCILAEA